MVQQDSCQSLRIIFFGTPDFAATILKTLDDWPKARLMAALCQPDRAAGRGRKKVYPAVKRFALDRHIPVFQPDNLQEEEIQQTIISFNPDILIVAAYGLIVPGKVLEIPPLGALNVHASLLPKYRGAAPIQRALLNGEKVTGITIMQMDEGMDTGDIILQRALAIGIDDTASSLHNQLAEMGGQVLVQALENWLEGTFVLTPQDPGLASYAPKLKKEEGEINWNQSALQVHNQIRAMYPWPGAYFDWRKPDNNQLLRLQIYPGYVGKEKDKDIPAGTIEDLQGDYLSIACLDRYYLTPIIKPASRKAITASEFYRGYLS